MGKRDVRGTKGETVSLWRWAVGRGARGGRAHMSAEFEIGILNSRHFCFDVSRVVIRSVGVYQRPGTRK